MRTTISIPDEVYSEAKTLAGSHPFSDFASEAIQALVLELKRERLARAMDEGYGIEARSPSLAGNWSPIEAEGL